MKCCEMAGQPAQLLQKQDRKTYELSHCAIHPAGSFGRFGSVGPLSGDTGGWGGVGAAIGSTETRWGSGRYVEVEGVTRGSEET